jgi:hypothetical protein
LQGGLLTVSRFLPCERAMRYPMAYLSDSMARPPEAVHHAHGAIGERDDHSKNRSQREEIGKKSGTVSPFSLYVAYEHFNVRCEISAESVGIYGTRLAEWSFRVPLFLRKGVFRGSTWFRWPESTGPLSMGPSSTGQSLPASHYRPVINGAMLVYNRDRGRPIRAARFVPTHRF